MNGAPIIHLCEKCQEPVHVKMSIHETDIIKFDVRQCKHCEESTRRFKAALKDFINQ